MNRLRLALHVLRGRPLMYRVEVYDSRVIRGEHTIVVESSVLGMKPEDDLDELIRVGKELKDRVDELLATTYPER